ncbi:MAG TPA: transcription termination factor Rho [Acidimicrobiales bacterium]|jgi:transcription termination factor Rho|nr:transcription termination factor Rho [Acidimicrobiales bacterium]
MSVESSALERSALERKDRGELTTIAQALGAKPPARARKAEIVQLILELTGVEGGASGADGADRTDGTDGADRAGGADTGVDTRDANDAPKQEVSGVDDPNRGSDTEPSSAPDEPPAEWETELGPEDTAGAKAEARAEPEAAASRTSAETAPADEVSSETNGQSRGASETGGNGDRPDRGQNRGQERGQDRGRAGGQPEGSADRSGGGAQQVDVNEPGNRRRRRRGRRGGGETHVEEFAGEPVTVAGLLDLRDEGYGFLRVKGWLPSKDDVYVSVKQVRQFGLRKGDHIAGGSRPALRNEKNPALLRIDQVNGKDPDQARQRRRFEDLTPLFPDQKLVLETAEDGSNMTARIVDLLSPIGKGQRGLIVSPPKAGKTTIMKQIARSIETNNTEVKLIVLLVDERPEEVTDMRRWLRSPNSEVVASTFDRPSEEHAQVSELTIERAKRLVEDSQDVCIILDGITRLARAYNLAAPATGRIMSGGVDSGALYPPKKFFGAARNIEEGGSLTILATALIETGSKMDEVIFEEFKGTGNMELRLDRRLSERRIYPAIDVDASSTRHEELLFPRNQLNLVWALRRVLSGLSSTDGGNAAALELLSDRMKTFRTNEEFLAEVAKNRLAAG